MSLRRGGLLRFDRIRLPVRQPSQSSNRYGAAGERLQAHHPTCTSRVLRATSQVEPWACRLTLAAPRLYQETSAGATPVPVVARQNAVAPPRRIPRSPEGPFRTRIDGRGGAIRTLDLLNPIQVRYQAAPRPEVPRQSSRGRCVDRSGHRSAGNAPDAPESQQTSVAPPAIRQIGRPATRGCPRIAAWNASPQGGQQPTGGRQPSRRRAQAGELKRSTQARKSDSSSFDSRASRSMRQRWTLLPSKRAL
jgi:hypothetical protein